MQQGDEDDRHPRGASVRANGTDEQAGAAGVNDHLRANFTTDG